MAAPPPTREARVLAELQACAAASVSITRSYVHAALLMGFVALYMGVLYSQAAAFQSGEVVAALRASLLPGGASPSLAFSSAGDVLAWLGNRVVQPVFSDPVCGDGRCDAPWEGPAWGPFGCEADCGRQPNTTRVVLRISADFTGHPAIAPASLMAQVSWNLCLNDTARQRRGLAPLCWFQDEQAFSEAVETQIQAFELADGTWYVRLDGDLAGRVTGALFDASAGDGELVELPVSPAWTECRVRRQRRPAAGDGSARRLLAEFTLARSGPGGQAAEQLLRDAVQQAAAAHARRS